MNPASAFGPFLNTLKTWLPVFLTVLLIAETLILLLRFKQRHGRETRVNLISGGMTIVVQAVFKTFLLNNVYPQVFENRLFNPGMHWYTWALGFLLYTFIQFATHAGYHKIRLFWCLHEVHHSAIHMNVTTGLRTSVFDVTSLDLCYLLIPFLGIHPVVYFILYTLNKFWGAFIHINEHIVSRIPMLEKWLVTPSEHHIHHARNPRYLDKNYGELVPWYDMLFGTWVRQTEKPKFGTLTVQHELGFWDSQLHEFRKLWRDVRNTPNWRHKWCYIWMPPGWSPTDKSMMASVIQKKIYARARLWRKAQACP
jgi:sterol desaturase/sphingolipid hydroxylase (fatty acid hydroxylase superfamily)